MAEGRRGLLAALAPVLPPLAVSVLVTAILAALTAFEARRPAGGAAGPLSAVPGPDVLEPSREIRTH